MNTERFHLTLIADGRPVMHGWWVSDVTARLKFTRWIGEFGALRGARVLLVDERDGSVVEGWPAEL